MHLTDWMRTMVRELPLRQLRGTYWRQTSPRRQPLALAPFAPRAGRWHAAGDPWPAYAASSQMAAMLELTRVVVPEAGVEPPLPRRRLSELYLDLPVVDLANPLALDQLQLSRDDLTRGFDASRETSICRELAAEVRARSDAHGLLVPSAARPGADVVVIFPSGFPHVTVGEQRIVELRLAPAPEEEAAPEPDG